MESAEEIVVAGARWLKIVFEGAGVLVIGVGFLRAIAKLVQEAFRRDTAEFARVRLAMAKYLVLALEFQLAADILSTAVSPSWEQIGKLGAIAVIRTGLNYFLMLEMREESREIKGEGENGPSRS